MSRDRLRVPHQLCVLAMEYRSHQREQIHPVVQTGHLQGRTMGFLHCFSGYTLGFTYS